MLDEKEKENKIKYLRSLDYPIMVKRIRAVGGKPGYYFVYLPDFGPCVCSGVGDTINDAIGAMNRTKKLVFQFLVDNGIPIPEPRPFPFCINS